MGQRMSIHSLVEALDESWHGDHAKHQQSQQHQQHRPPLPPAPSSLPLQQRECALALQHAARCGDAPAVAALCATIRVQWGRFARAASHKGGCLPRATSMVAAEVSGSSNAQQQGQAAQAVVEMFLNTSTAKVGAPSAHAPPPMRAHIPATPTGTAAALLACIAQCPPTTPRARASQAPLPLARAHPHLLTHATQPQGQTPLSLAAQAGNPAVVKQLLHEVRARI